MAEIEKTPTLGLNKPPAGYFEWDTPINENWDKLDFLGAGQLPLLWHIDVRHKLAGDQLAGWALQGTELDGAVYTTVWDILWAAKQRAATEYSIQVRGKTYYFNQDAVTGLVFVNDTNYNAALSALGDSLGYIVSYNAGVKRIRLPKDSSLDLPVLDNSLPGGFVDETLPNITGRFAGGTGDSTTATGAFTRVGTDTAGQKVDGTGTDATILPGLFNFDASKSSVTYKTDAKVFPRSHRVYRYYKVGNTIANSQIIDVSNLLNQVNSLAARVSKLEGVS